MCGHGPCRRPSRRPRCGLLWVTDRCSRQLALAAGPEVLFGLQLRHAKQVTENHKPVTLGQLDQFDNGLRDEGHGLVRAALPNRFIRWQSPIPA